MNETQEQVRLDDTQVEKKVAKLADLKEDLEQSRKATGFRKLTKKNEQALSNKIQELALEIANEYMARYEALCKMFGMEIRAVMRVNPAQPNISQAVTELKPYAPKPKNIKPWHEAMADNLHTRAKCEHVEHAEGDKCEKCGLPKFATFGEDEPIKAWGAKGKGVTAEYLAKQKERIEQEKQIQEEADAEEKE